MILLHQMVYYMVFLLCWKELECLFNGKLKDIHHPLLFSHDHHHHQQQKHIEGDDVSSTSTETAPRIENARFSSPSTTATKTSSRKFNNKIKTRYSDELDNTENSFSSDTPAASSSKLKKFNKMKTNGLDVTGITNKPTFMTSCKHVCKCVHTTPPTPTISKPAARIITDYLVDCSSIKNFQEVGKLEVPKGKTVKAIIRDAAAKIVNGTCITSDTAVKNKNSDNKRRKRKSEVCFPSDIEFPLFKRIRVLQLQDFPRLTNLGNQQSDFFSILPNVRSLSINTKAAVTKSRLHPPVNIYFSNTVQNLKDLKIKLSMNETMKLSCRSKSCLPTSLNSLTVKYSTASSLNLNTSMSLPKVIKNVSITIDSRDKQISSFGKPSDIISGAKIKNLQLRLTGNTEFAVSLKNTKVLKSFQLIMSPTQIVKGIPYYYHYKQLYEIFNNPPLKRLVDVTLLGGSTRKSRKLSVLPVMIRQQRTHFKKSFFDTCRLAKNLLSNANETVIDDDHEENRRKIFVRGFVYDLVDVLELFETFDEVVVSTYHATISRTFKVPRNKTLKVRYFKIGTSIAYDERDNTGGIQSIGVNPNLENSRKFTFQSLSVRADLVKYSSTSDPIFVRALSLCIIQNIGAFMKRKAGSKSTFNLDKKDFWLVGTSFPANLTFDDDFDIEEKALAWQSLSNMNRYLQTVVETRNNMKTMSKVSLRNIDYGRYFFQTYGQKILDNHEDKASMLDANSSDRSSLMKVDLKDRISKFRWQTLDHAYHAITVYKDRLLHVLDSHTNGRPLLYQLVSMFNKYKTKVDENNEKLNKVSKQSNSFTRAKIITVIINALSLLFEDKRTFEHTIKTLDNDWKPDSVDKIIQNMKAIRKLVLALDSISVTFTKMKSRMESKELKFQKYAESLSKLVKRLINTKSGKTNQQEHQKIRTRLRTLDSLKTEVAYPDQVVKLVFCIEDIIQLGRQLDGSAHRQVFDKVPEPMSFFNPNEVNLLYHKALNVSIDQSMKWSEIKSWLTSTLNATTLKQLFQTLDVRYPIIDLVETAEDITQEMVSNFGYQMTGNSTSTVDPFCYLSLCFYEFLND